MPRRSGFSKTRKKHDKIRPINEHLTELTITVTNESLQEAERLRSLEARKGNFISVSEAYQLAMHRDVERRDPVKKAKRLEARRAKKSNPKSWAPRILAVQEATNGRNKLNDSLLL